MSNNNYYHNQGQSDGAKDANYSPSFANAMAGIMSFGLVGTSSNYNPPSNPDDRKAYDAGYENGKFSK